MHEIDVNPRLGRNLSYYIKEIAQVASRYTNLLSNNGRLILILHNSNKKVFNETIEQMKKYVDSLQYREIAVKHYFICTRNTWETKTKTVSITVSIIYSVF